LDLVRLLAGCWSWWIFRHRNVLAAGIGIDRTGHFDEFHQEKLNSISAVLYQIHN